MSETERRERLGAYLDGELEGEERTALEQELERDADLRDELERLRRTSTQLRSFYGQEVETAVDEDGEAVAVERIVRMSTTALRRGDIERPPRRSFLLIAAVAVMVVGLGILFASPWLSGEPTAEDLLENARKELDTGFMEFEVASAILRSSGVNSPLDLWEVVWEGRPELLYRRGPGGLAHLQLGLGSSGLEEHLGRDSQSNWAKRSTDTGALRFDEPADPRTEVLFRLVERMEKGLGQILEDARKHPDALDLVGRVSEGDGPELWKIRLGGALVDRRASFWFDDEGRLARIKFATYDLSVNRDSKIGAEDLELESILPGLSIEDRR